MSKFSSEQKLQMNEKLKDAIDNFAYRYERYSINYSIAVGCTSDNIDITPMSRFVRASDCFVVLDQNTCVVIFDCTNDDCGIKAANNMLTLFQGANFSSSLYSSIVTASNYSTPELAIKDLFYLLDYAIKHNMNGVLMEHATLI
jgi:hypothetical protein